MSGSGLSLHNLRSEHEARAQRERGHNPASVYDHSVDFYDDVRFAMKPGYRERARRRARLWRLLVGGVAAVILSVLAMMAFLFVAGQGGVW